MTLTFEAVANVHAVLGASCEIPGVIYKTEPTPPEPPELCPHKIPIDDPCDECAKEMGLSDCEQCGELAWDGRICHSCGMKDI